MSTAAFISSLVASLSWPVVIICVVVIFRAPLSALIGRIKSYKGLGQEVTFGDRLAGAEASVEEALMQSRIAGAEAHERLAAEPSPLVREAEGNPSFVVIRGWEQMLEALADLFAAAFPEEEQRRTQPLQDLERSKIAPREYVTAVRELRDLRNRVAHGLHNPTPGEAVAFAQSVSALMTATRTMVHALTRVQK
jgi:hypothetical protein